MDKDVNSNCYCIIGGGIIGAWTALHLARMSVPCVLIEQFPFDHTRGSSHGGSRAFRMLGTDNLSMLEYSLSEWKKLELNQPDRLFIQTGLINLGERNDPFLTEAYMNMLKGGYSVKWLSPEEITELCPMTRYPENWWALYDQMGGLLVANTCLHAVKEEYVQHGGKMIQAVVKSVTHGKEGLAKVHLQHTSGLIEELCFKKVVVCAGPWTSKLFPNLRPVLTTKLIPVTYWQDINERHDPGNNLKPGIYSVSNGFPIIFNARLTDVYAFPSFEYPGMTKVLYHGGPEADPDAPGNVSLEYYIQHVADYVKSHFPLLDHKHPAISERCFYTCTPDQYPILDIIDNQIVIGAGFSGSGFKHSPAMGKSLASLALGKESELPEGFQLEKYRVNRFKN